MSKVRSLIRILKVLLMVLPVLVEAMKLLNDDTEQNSGVLPDKGVPIS
jgi:hypothetical protein